MLRTFAKTTLLAAALFATACSASQPSRLRPKSRASNARPVVAGQSCGLHHKPTANCRPQYYGQPDLFYNYYVPGTCGGVPANMYLAPQPVPQMVGHTYYTYQPFMPHELLYQHHRNYYRYYDGGRGMTRTHVSWSRPPLTGWNSSLRIAR